MKQNLRIAIGLLLFAVCITMNSWASREERVQLRQRAVEERNEALMRDLSINAPPKWGGNEVGAVNHFLERASDDTFKIHAYPKYFFADDGTLQESEINLQPLPVRINLTYWGPYDDDFGCADQWGDTEFYSITLNY